MLFSGYIAALELALRNARSLLVSSLEHNEIRLLCGAFTSAGKHNINYVRFIGNICNGHAHCLSHS